MKSKLMIVILTEFIFNPNKKPKAFALGYLLFLTEINVYRYTG